MPLVVNDRVRETTVSTGTGVVTLDGAPVGFQSFAAIGNANTTYYCIADKSGSNWEVGIGTYTASGTTLSRDTVLSSSNAGALVDFGAGTKDVFCTSPARIWASAAPTINIVTGTSQAATAGNHYVLTNVAATTVTLPASAIAGDVIWVSVGNDLRTNVIARNGLNIEGLAENLTLNLPNVTVMLRYANATLGWIITSI